MMAAKQCELARRCRAAVDPHPCGCARQTAQPTAGIFAAGACTGPDSFTFHATASESVAAADARAGLKEHEPFGAGIVDDAFVQAVPKQRELDSIGPDLAAPHGAGISLVRLAVMDLRPLA